MKRLGAIFIGLIIIVQLAACSRGELRHESGENALYSDLHTEFKVQSRRLDFSYLVSNQIKYAKPKNKQLSELTRFVFVEDAPVSGGSGMVFAADTRSHRIYTGESGVLSNVLENELILDYTQKDFNGLVAKLEAVNVRSWTTKARGMERLYSVGIEYADGSIEQYFVNGADAKVNELLTYLQNERAAYKDRSIQDRKTAVHVDYLIAYSGWDPSMDGGGAPGDVTFSNIDRLMVFQAEGPHEILDHSRSAQKTLLFDVVNGQLYYDPQKTVYEDITKAAHIKALEAGTFEEATTLLEQAGVTGWNANAPYITDADAVLTLLGSDIPAWAISIQYADGRIVHFSGDGIGEGGKPEGCDALLEQLFALAG